MDTFINLPVKDLARSTEFFTALGFAVDEHASDESATRVIISEGASLMLTAESLFEVFIAPQTLSDTSKAREVIVGLSAESREQVDQLTDNAIGAGGEGLGEPIDDGFMYMRGFRDPDGHQWSFIHFDL